MSAGPRPPYIVDWSAVTCRFLVDLETRQGYRRIRREKRLLSPDTSAKIAAVGAALDAAAVRWWVSYGALLGIIRDGKFMDDDNDVDIVIAPGTEPAAVGQALVAAGAIQLTDIRHGRRVTNENYWFRDLYVDIYYCHDHRGNLVDYSRFSGCVMLLEHERQEVSRHAFQGVELNVPADPARYLHRLYGPGWNTRDADWTWYVQQPVVEIRGRPWNLARCFFRREIRGR